MMRATHVIDASDRSLGRVATEAVRLLIGKHKATYQPQADEGDAVRIIHASRIRWTGKKIDQKKYTWSTMHPGGLKTQPVREWFLNDPGSVVKAAVSNMLPKNTFRAVRLKRLIVEA